MISSRFFRPDTRRTSTVLLMFVTLPLFAQDFEEGDSVLLIERDIHIPAHPSPLDNSIPFRFVSGSVATVLQTDDDSGWIEIRGDRLESATDTGWITARYIAGFAEEAPTNSEPLDVAWCPPVGLQTPRTGRLRLASWNLGNLHAVDGQSTYTGSDPSVTRSATDYERIRCYVRLFDPDILAVQEVDGEDALERIVDTEIYNIHVSDRRQPSFINGRQNTGFAYKKGLTAQEHPDFEDLDVSNGSLRFGARLDVTFGGITYQLMSVHLKSGCFSNSSSSSACDKLTEQIPILEGWIDDAAASPNPPIVLGDFNRRFNMPGDSVWTTLDDGVPANADLTSITNNMPISCRDNEYTSFIDHIVFDARAVDRVDVSSFRHMTYRQDDRLVWDKISDHCPVVVEMWTD